MNCAEFDDWLNEFLDGESPADRMAAEQHDSACPACRGRLAAAQRLAEGLRLLRAPTPSAWLAQQITSRVAAQSARRRRRALALGLAAAAALLLAVVGGVRWTNAPRSGPANGGAQAPVAVQIPAGGSVRHEIREAGSALAGLVGRTAEEAVKPGRLLWPTRAPSPTSVSVSLHQPETGRLPWPEAPVKPLRDAGETVVVTLEPVFDSARRAVQLFAREVPAARQATGTDRLDATPR